MHLFLHGLDSSSMGTKGSYFREHFPHMLLPDFTGSLGERMAQLDAITRNRHDLLLVGSSFGGLMAAIHALEQPERTAKIILLAPALNFPEFQPYSESKTAVPAMLFQGRRDTVTPLAAIRPAAEQIFLNLDFHELDDDHLLHNSFHTINWGALLD